jgi:hypothetical protein
MSSHERRSPRAGKRQKYNPAQKVIFDVELIGGESAWHFSRPFWVIDIMMDVMKFSGTECSSWNPGQLALSPKKSPRLKHKTTPGTFIMIIDGTLEIRTYYEEHVGELQEAINKKMTINGHSPVVVRIVQSDKV